MKSKHNSNNTKLQKKDKRYHKKQLAALTDSMYKYPYQNLSLVDMDMEKWKDIPGYEGYYMASNKGRIKSLSREIAHYIGRNFISHRTEEQIIKQSIYRTYSKYRDEYTEALIFRVMVDNCQKMCRVSRVVYEAFIGPIPKGMLVLRKGDSLDNSVENLYLATHKELAQIKQRRNREFINAKGGLFAEKMVSQYDLEGNYIATFNSIAQAAEISGVDAPGITEVVNGKRITSKGYFWRKGNDQTKLDVAAIMQRAREKQKAGAKVHQRQIVQYSLKGEYIDTYESINAAVEKTGLSRAAITNVILGKRFLSREFIWKYVDSFDDKIPERIKPEKQTLPKPTFQKRTGQQYPHYDYPYQDLSLFDMEGEIWKAVPTLEAYCMVSNFGRIKTVPRFIDRPNHGRILLKEKILKQSLRSFNVNKLTGKKNHCLYFGISINGVITQMAVARAVYSAFIDPLPDFKESKLFILHKDMDNLNNRVENLYPATREQLGQRNVRGNLMTPPDISKFTNERLPKIKKIHNKPVSQYSMKGEHVTTYSGIDEAGKKTKVYQLAIGQVAVGK